MGALRGKPRNFEGGIWDTCADDFRKRYLLKFYLFLGLVKTSIFSLYNIRYSIVHFKFLVSRFQPIINYPEMNYTSLYCVSITKDTCDPTR